MDRQHMWVMACACLWTASATLMMVASFQDGHLFMVMAAWSLLIGIAASTLCSKAAITAALDQEHIRVEELAAIIAREALDPGDGDVRHFHR